MSKMTYSKNNMEVKPILQLLQIHKQIQYEKEFTKSLRTSYIFLT